LKAAVQALQGHLCDSAHTQIAHTFVSWFKDLYERTIERLNKDFKAGPGAAHMALIASHDAVPAAHSGSTYLPQIHIYRDTYLSSL
jgi:hypothetical protein